MTAWAPALVSPATHGWNADDLNQIIDDWATDTGITPDPQSPVAFLRWLLGRHDLAFSPTLLETARGATKPKPRLSCAAPRPRRSSSTRAVHGKRRA